VNILVTGGSGFVGREIIRQLRSAGHAPRVLARGVQSPQVGVEFVRGSVLEQTSLIPACAGCDAIIHLVGIISERGEQTYERVHTDGTRNLLAAAQAAGISRFLHMSALGTRANATARYHRSKWAAEEDVRASGRAWTIFRPSLVYGPGDGFVNLFARMSRWSPMLPVFGDGKSLVQPIAVEDVAHSFVTALKTPASVGETYDLCGRERLTFNAVLDEILDATRRRRLKLHLPLPLARLQARLLEFIFPALLRQAPPLNRDQLLMLAEDNVGDPEPACRAFHFEPLKFGASIRRFLSKGDRTTAA
jgi:NADH dehydrogenase